MIGLLNRRLAQPADPLARLFQSAGRMIGLLNLGRHPHRVLQRSVSIRRADDWAFEPRLLRREPARAAVSIRRADDWAFELPDESGRKMVKDEFQSAGRMIGLLNTTPRELSHSRRTFQSAGRMIGLLNK